MSVREIKQNEIDKKNTVSFIVLWIVLLKKKSIIFKKMLPVEMLRSALEKQLVAFKFRPPFDVLAAKKKTFCVKWHVYREYLLDLQYRSNSSIR